MPRPLELHREPTPPTSVPSLASLRLSAKILESRAASGQPVRISPEFAREVAAALRVLIAREEGR